jgi:tetratricopeptide (TPR) repeat protein
MAAVSAALMRGERPAEIRMLSLPGLPPGLSEALQMRTLHGPAGGIAYARSWIEKHPADALPLWRLMVEAYLDLNQNEVAVELAAHLFQKYEQDGPLTYLFGIALRRVGKKEESHDALISAAHMLAPLESHAWGGAAAGQSERGEMAFAAANYRVALFLDDSNPYFWGDLAQIELIGEQYRAAHHAFSKAIGAGQRSFINYYYRGLAALGMGDDLSSVQDWGLALYVDPSHPKASEILNLIASRAEKDTDHRFCFGDLPILK